MPRSYYNNDFGPDYHEIEFGDRRIVIDLEDDPGTLAVYDEEDTLVFLADIPELVNLKIH